MTQHRCIYCKRPITWQFALCRECEKIFGKPSQWPAWLRFMWANIQRERRETRKQQHYEVALNDEFDD